MNYFENIPKLENPKYRNEIVIDNGEKLVNILDTNLNVLFIPMYYTNKIPGAITSCFMRESVCNMLNEASSLLPEGYRFKIFDAWRPFQVQKYLYEKYFETLMQKERFKNNPLETRIEVEKYLSFPNENPKYPFVHSTGGAIDLTIVDGNNEDLDMGTRFDDFCEESSTAYFELFTDSKYNEIKNNRRMLYNVMCSVGFTNLPNEWWHFDYGDNFWAVMTKSKAFYLGKLDLV